MMNIDYELEARRHEYMLMIEEDYDMEIPDEIFDSIELTEIEDINDYLPF